MITAISGFFNIILIYLFNVFGNYGVSIIVFTLLVRLVTYPLTNKQIQSAQQMQKLQPELKKIQEKYKDDKEKQNQATMEFMKNNKMNPLAGCLPLLIQFPILIAIFNLLREPEMIEAALPNFSPTFLYLDLTQPDSLFILPVIAGVTTFLHQQIMMTDPNQKMMLYVLPVMILIFSINFPAGLVLYWVINNFVSIAHHFFVTKPGSKGVVEER